MKILNKPVKLAPTQAEALPHQPSWRHVLLCFDLAEVERAGEHQDVHHGHETRQEGDRRLWRHALRRLNVLQLRLRERGGEIHTHAHKLYDEMLAHEHNEVDAVSLVFRKVVKHCSALFFETIEVTFRKCMQLGLTPTVTADCANKQEKQPLSIMLVEWNTYLYDEIWQHEVFYTTQRKYSLMTHR